MWRLSHFRGQRRRHSCNQNTSLSLVDTCNPLLMLLILFIHMCYVRRQTIMLQFYFYLLLLSTAIEWTLLVRKMLPALLKWAKMQQNRVPGSQNCLVLFHGSSVTNCCQNTVLRFFYPTEVTTSSGFYRFVCITELPDQVLVGPLWTDGTGPDECRGTQTNRVSELPEFTLYHLMHFQYTLGISNCCNPFGSVSF